MRNSWPDNYPNTGKRLFTFPFLGNGWQELQSQRFAPLANVSVETITKVMCIEICGKGIGRLGWKLWLKAPIQRPWCLCISEIFKEKQKSNVFFFLWRWKSLRDVIRLSARAWTTKGYSNRVTVYTSHITKAYTQTLVVRKP